MALSEIKVIIIDLDTVLTKGIDDVYMAMKMNFRKPPALWIWIPESF